MSTTMRTAPNTDHFDAIAIGAGQAGVPLAPALAGSGRRTALIEREHAGGTCVNEGCTPTKTECERHSRLHGWYPDKR